jgi:hypothetical protein
VDTARRASLKHQRCPSSRCSKGMLALALAR